MHKERTKLDQHNKCTSSGGAEDHKWQRKGARRAGGRQRRGHPMHQDEVEDEESSPRSRTRSGAVSGGAARRSHQNTVEEDDQQTSNANDSQHQKVKTPLVTHPNMQLERICHPDIHHYTHIKGSENN